MIILAMDTSGPVAGVALMENGAVRYEAMAVNRFTHSQSILPMAEEAYAKTGRWLAWPYWRMDASAMRPWRSIK